MFYQKIIDGDTKRYKIFSITVLKKIKTKYEYTIYFLGIRIFHKSNLKWIGEYLLEIHEDLQRRIETSVSVARTHHETFSAYKNIFQGKDLVIVGSGSTLQKYHPIPNAIHIALNKSYLFEKVKFDFLFIQDILGLKDDINAINNYGPEFCKKFYGISLKHCCSIPEPEAMKGNAKRFYVGGRITPFYPDIASCALADYGSIVFSALAFALYTHPKRIYLVGCDVSKGYFFDINQSPTFTDSPNMGLVIPGWQAFKKFAEEMYPDVEIISINPVGLKGMFKEHYFSE